MINQQYREELHLALDDMIDDINQNHDDIKRQNDITIEGYYDDQDNNLKRTDFTTEFILDENGDGINIEYTCYTYKNGCSGEIE